MADQKQTEQKQEVKKSDISLPSVTPVAIKLPENVTRSVSLNSVIGAIESGVRVPRQSWSSFVPLQD